MSTAVESLATSPRPLSPSNDAILSTVAQTEMINRFVPIGILGVLFGLPTIAALFERGLGGALLTGIIMFVVSGFAIRIVNGVVLRPMQHVRYKLAAKTLGGQMQALSEPVVQWFSWWTFAPGALAITRAGQLVIVDRSTDYTHLWLARDQIVNLGVEREATQITNTKHSGKFTFGGVTSSGVFGAFTTGGRSKSTTTTIETAFLEIRYQLERNGQVYTSVIPFDGDRRGAEQLRAQIDRLQAS